MKYLSTFSGIGGFELGIIQAYETNNNQQASSIKQNGKRGNRDTNDKSVLLHSGSKSPLCVGYSEIDKYAIQIYQKQFPNHKNYGDITKINPKDLPDFDLLVGGFPCQSFSIAGKRGGFNDTRGTMFFELARIIKKKRPRLFVFENVKGLLSHDQGNTFSTIICTLDELGYDCQWQVLNSKNHGVPQNRERVFIIGHLRGTSRPEVFPFGEDDKLSNKENKSNERQSQDTTVRPDVGQKADGTYIVVDHGKIRNTKQVNAIDANYWKGFDNHGQRTGIKRGEKIRRLTPTECERLQGFPDGWTSVGKTEQEDYVVISDTQRYKTLGNAVTVNVIRDIMEKLL